MRTGETDLIGALLEQRYRIDGSIARGGMSTVFRGLDLRLDRPVAIKVMDPRFAADPEFLARFEFEARAVARLKHPGLVAVYDQGHDGDYAFLVMELVEGGTLRELLRERGPMPPHAVRAVAEPVLDALGVAHRAGLVHRDVKPENVLISDSGEVKIADFGLVRAIAAASTTSSSVILGTAAYLSPEQVANGTADARSDVYSFGVMVFEMLTGRAPFVGDTSLSIAYQRLDNDVPTPGRFIAGVPAEFDSLVAEATAREPAHRFADAAVMAASLRTIAETLELPAYRVPAPRRSAEHRSHAVPAGRTTDLAGPTTNLAAQMAGPQPTKVETALHSRRPDEHPDYYAAAPEPDDYGGYPADHRGRPRRVLLIVLAAFLLLAVAVGVGGWLLGSGNYVAVPTVDGFSQDRAMNAVKNAGFNAQLRTAYSDSRPVGNVLGTDPPGGTQASKNSTVAVLVSGGRPKVPAVSPGADLASVQQQIRDAGLQPVDGPAAYDRNVPEGTVVRVEPKPGLVVLVGSTVTITTSRGPAPAQMPDLVGATAEEATAALSRLGATVANPPSNGAARVTATDPPAGGDVGPGSTVTLQVSEAVRIPWLLGKSVKAARMELEALGLQVQVSQLGRSERGSVIGQQPGVGSMVPPGTTVILTALPF